VAGSHRRPAPDPLQPPQFLLEPLEPPLVSCCRPLERPLGPFRQRPQLLVGQDGTPDLDRDLLTLQDLFEHRTEGGVPLGLPITRGGWLVDPRPSPARRS
jgi:hypothetical protein